MKAEINNENKAKFFALYWRQNVFMCEYYSKPIKLIGTHLDYLYGMDYPEYYLQLKPLSSISDEDASELAKYFKVTEADFWTDQFEKYRTGRHFDDQDDVIYHFEKVGRDICEMIEDTSFFSKRVWHKDESDIIIAADYLRSKGYAIPWMGLSVEEMVEAGWIKLV
jgi:hypothetical protein